jgi:hypothetical protein
MLKCKNQNVQFILDSGKWVHKQNTYASKDDDGP